MDNFATQQARQKPIRLTRREVEVLNLVMEGLSSQAVADRLFVCKKTVDFHLENIYEKLEVKTRVQALRRALEWGLIRAV